MKRLSFVVIWLLSLLTGCASFNAIKTIPAQIQPSSFTVSKELPSKMSELPIGVYNIPESKTYLSGHQKGLGVGMFFGLIGIAIANSANESRGKEMLKEIESSLKLDLVTSTERVLGQQIDALKLARRYTVAPKPYNGTMQLLPYLVLSFVNETEARPFVILRASYADANGKETWWTRYISGAAEKRNLAGENGWASNNGKVLQDAVEATLNSAPSRLFFAT
jgi:hypothetical protein